jgi:RHS repeat-associated protein
MQRIRMIFLLALLSFSSLTLGQSALKVPNGLDPSKISLPHKQGTLLSINGTVGVSGQSGGTSIELPLGLPEWRQLWTGLSLSYASNDGLSQYGYGWQIKIPSIQRPARLGVPRKESDLYSSTFDSELVNVGGSLYRARLEEAEPRIYALNNNVFTMQDGTGRTYYFGEDAASRLENSSSTLKWHVTRIKDSFDNQVVFTYERFEEVVYVKSISFREASGQVVFQAKFSYTSLPGFTWTSWRAGTEQKFARFLKQVEILSVGHRIRRYELQYQLDRLNQRPMLSQINRWGRTDADTIPPWTLEYSSAEPSTAQANARSGVYTFGGGIGPLIGSNEHRFIDVNRDGLIDILSRTSTQLDSWFVWINPGQASTEMRASPFSVQNFDLGIGIHALADINGDRQMDVMIFDGIGSVRALYSSGTSYKETMIQGLGEVNFSAGSDAYDWVDLDADSKADLVVYFGGSYRIFRNMTVGDNIIFVASDGVGTLPENPGNERRWTDINGDSLPDLVYFLPNTNVRGSSSALKVSYQDGYGNLTPESGMIPLFQTCCLMSIPDFYDLNNDGLVDILLRDAGQVEILLQSKDQNGLPQFTSKFLFGPTLGQGAAEVFIGQINQLVVADANGDGEEDLVYTTPESPRLFFTSLDMASTRPHMLEKHDNGLGGQWTYRYGVNSSSYELPIIYTTLQTLKGNGLVAGPTGKTRQDFRFEQHRFRDGVYDFERNEFLGYGKHDTYEFLDGSSKGRVRIDEYYTRENPLLQGLKKSQEIRALDSAPATTPLQTEVYEYGIHGIQEKVWFRYLKKQDFIRSEPGENPKLQRLLFCYELDPQSQTLRSVLKRHTDETGQVSLIEETIYLPSSRDNWRTKLRAVEAKYLPQGDTFYRAEGQAFVYKNNVIDQLMYWDDRKQPAQWTPYLNVERNSNGSIVLITDPKGRRTKIDYQPDAEFLVRTVTDNVSSFGREFNLETTYEWDLTVEPKLQKVIDANSAIQEFDWDGLGRLVAIRTANSEEPDYTFTYLWGNDLNFSSIGTRTRYSNGIINTQYFDSLQREIGSVQTTQQGFVLQSYAILDALGRKQNAVNSMPVNSNSLDNLPGLSSYAYLYSYDARDRLISSRAPWLTGTAPPTTMQYRRNYTLTRNSENEVQVDYLDAQDRVCAVSLFKDRSINEATLSKSPCGLSRTPSQRSEFLLNIAYDGLDRIVGINLNGKENRVYTYGSNGAIAEIKTDGTGNWRFVYDDAGQLIARYLSNSRGIPKEALLYAYDQLGREIERRSMKTFSGDVAKDRLASQGEYRFFYDEAVVDDAPSEFTRGRLAALELFPGARIDYGYDSKGNVTRELARIYQESIETSYRYDDLSRPLQVSFPDNSNLSFSYDSGRIMLPTGGEFADLAFSLTYDSQQSLTEFAAGSYKLNMAYDPIRLTKTGIEASWNGATILSMRLSDFDNQLRIRKIQGWNSPGNAVSLEYDGMGQLNRFVGIANQRFPNGQTYTYSPEQLLLGKGSEVASLAKSPDGFELKFTNDIYSFGDLGRLVETPDARAIEWDPQARLGCVADIKNEKTRYSYFPDGHVFGRESSATGQALSVAYLNRYIEYNRTSKSFRKYLTLMGMRFAHQDDKGSIVFYAKDHAKSTRLIAAESERKPVEIDPWGSLRNEDFDAELRGFGDGRQQPATGLVQFKGRYYNTEIGWFASPDQTYLLNPENCVDSPIECNLWSYAQNDPINKGDEDGDAAHILGGIIAGGALNLTIDALSGNITSFESGVGSFVEGAINGAAAASGAGLLGGTAVSGLAKAANQYISHGKLDYREISSSAVSSLVGGKIFKNLPGPFTPQTQKISANLRAGIAQVEKEIASTQLKTSWLRSRSLASDTGKYIKRYRESSESMKALNKGLNSLKSNYQRAEFARGGGKFQDSCRVRVS